MLVLAFLPDNWCVLFNNSDDQYRPVSNVDAISQYGQSPRAGRTIASTSSRDRQMVNPHARGADDVEGHSRVIG